MEIVEQLLHQLKKAQDAKHNAEEVEIRVRIAIFTELKKNQLEQYKSETATVSYTKGKKVVYEDPEEALKMVEKAKLVKYIEVIPETKKLNKQFEEDIKEGITEVEGVSVEPTEIRRVQFAKKK